jgi:hypothetical protein
MTGRRRIARSLSRVPGALRGLEPSKRHTVNVAARLQQGGAPGQVTISEETYRLIRKSFECRPLGTVSLKGKTDPIQTFEVVGLWKEGGSPRETESSRTPFIGREEELKQLLEMFARARKERTQVVSLIGEAGIGKSRLVHAFRERIADRPHTWLECRGSPYTQDSAFYPVLETQRLRDASGQKTRHQT